jgi:DNA modification methylase
MSGLERNSIIQGDCVEILKSLPYDESKASHPSGRYPANLVLTHSPGCKRVGTAKMKGSSKPRTENKGYEEAGSGKSWSIQGGRPEGFVNPGYGDEEGMEEIEAWECEPDCPVRIMNEQVSPTKSAGGRAYQNTNDMYSGGWGDEEEGVSADPGYGNYGGPSRFFYTSKATGRENYNTHPTLKPVDLCEWLVRIITKPGDLVLDPFAGSGTTGIAANHANRDYVLIEREPQYIEIIERRLKEVQTGLF